MKKFKITVLKRGFIMEKNYIMAKDIDEATNKFKEDSTMNDEWEVINYDMSTEDVDIKEVK